MTFRPRPLSLLDFPAESGNEFQRTVRENFRRIRDWIAPFGGGMPSLDLLGWLLGGDVLTAVVMQVSGSDGDTVLDHGLERVPAMVALSVDREGLGGMVLGAPDGGRGSSGSNETAWTRTALAVRASRTGEYSFLVI